MNLEEKNEKVKSNQDRKLANQTGLLIEKEITLEYVKSYLLEKEFDLQPTQGKISFPIINKYCNMLRDGSKPPPIKTEKNSIVDGHHRYISGHILGILPEKIKCPRPKANKIRSWKDIIVDIIDHTQPD